MPDIDINPGEPPVTPTTEEPGTPPAAAPDAPSAEELTRQLEDARRQATEAQQERERLSQAYNTLAMSAMSVGSRSPEPPPEPEAAMPNREEDPDGYVAAMISKGVKEAIKAEVTPIVEQYRNDRSSQFSSTIESQRFMMRADKENYPDFGEVEKDVMQYASQFTPEQLARPGALHECYVRIAGQRYIELQKKERTRTQASIETGGRATSSGSSSHLERLTDREVNFARRSEMDDSQFRALQGSGKMSIDDWDALEAKGKAS